MTATKCRAGPVVVFLGWESGEVGGRMTKDCGPKSNDGWGWQAGKQSTKPAKTGLRIQRRLPIEKLRSS